MAFVKLDTGILDSTLWVERECREIFITALLLAMPSEIETPMPQYEVRSLKETGFIVPPGWYGFIHAAGVGIIRRAMVEQELGLCALERLGSIDPESRSSEFDGRRLVRVDGGYIVLNFIKYREKDATGADRVRRWRERQKAKTSNALPADANALPVTLSNQAEAEAEAEAEVKKEKRSPNGSRFSLTELPEGWKGYCHEKRPDLNPDSVFENFKDFWSAKAGKDGRKADWPATWRTWVRNEKASNGRAALPDYSAVIANIRD